MDLQVEGQTYAGYFQIPADKRSDMASRISEALAGLMHGKSEVERDVIVEQRLGFLSLALQSCGVAPAIADGICEDLASNAALIEVEMAAAGIVPLTGRA